MIGHQYKEVTFQRNTYKPSIHIKDLHCTKDYAISDLRGETPMYVFCIFYSLVD